MDVAIRFGQVVQRLRKHADKCEDAAERYSSEQHFGAASFDGLLLQERATIMREVASAIDDEIVAPMREFVRQSG